MLAAMQNNPVQFEYARYCDEYLFENNEATTRIDRTKFKQFKAEVVSEQEMQYSQPIRNMITQQGNIVLRTNWDLHFMIQKEVFFRDSWWIIQNVKKTTMDVNPNTLGMRRLQPLYLLVLMEME